MWCTMKIITYLMTILILTTTVFAFTPIVGSPLANNEHPRIHITQDSLPKIRAAIAGDPVLRQKYQEYVDWAKDQDINSKDNTISDAGHVVLHPQMIDQALIAQIGEVDGVTFPEGWNRQRYANVAIDTLRARLEEGSDISYPAAITYDWTYDFMTPDQRADMANMILNAKITHKKFDFTVKNPISPDPIEMFSSKYYECSYPYYHALAIYGEADVDEALDSFYNQMLDYGYFDAMHFVGEEGGWNEWDGYSSWHPKNHLLNIDAWRTATREDYITGNNVRVKAKVPLGHEANYAKFIQYAIDPHHYTAEPNSPLELDAYTFIRTGGASTTDTSLDHNEKRQELSFIGGMLYDAGLLTEAGLIRSFNDRYDLDFIQYPQHWAWAFLGAEGSMDKITPKEAGLPKSLWAKNHGTFFARTGFDNEADGVFTASDSHFRYNGHGGADDFPGFTLNKFGPLVNTRYVAHRGYGNLEDYEGAFRYNVIDFGVDERYKQFESKEDLKNYLQGDSSYDLGGIMQATVQEDNFYHVRSDRSELFNGIIHTRDYVWLPGANHETDADVLVIYDRTRGSTEARWIYHVPWLPEASGYSSKTDLTTGTGPTDTKGTRYTGTQTILKELNGIGGEDDSDEHHRGTGYTAGAGAHGVLFARTLLPKTVHTDVTRVAYLDDEVLNRQDNLAIKSHRWQVAVVPQDSSEEYRFLNIMVVGEEDRLTTMPSSELIETGSFDGVLIDGQSSGKGNVAVLFNKDQENFDGSISYSIDELGTTKNIIIGLDPTRTYTVTVGSSTFTVNPLSAETWEYIDGTHPEKIGVITFDTSSTGTVTVTPNGQAVQTCSDGTVEGSCSLDKPYYCENSALIPDCQRCGCDDGKTCQDDGFCLVVDECEPIEEICGNGVDEDCDGADLACEWCGEGSVSQRCQCGNQLINDGYCCDDIPSDSPCTQTNYSDSDINKDGVVDLSDFQILKEGYGSKYSFIDLLFFGRDFLSEKISSGDSSYVLLSEGFEGEETSVDPFIDGTDSSVTLEEHHSGTHSLKMCAGEGCKFSYRQYLSDSSDTLYARYWFKIGNPDAWYYADGSPKTGEHYKNPGFEGGGTGCKGGDYFGDDCMTVRTRLVTPYYGVWTEGFVGNINSVDESVNVIDGDWHCIEMKVHLNTPGNNDGKIVYWIDGHENVIPDLTFRNDYSWEIDKWWWTYWSNDNWLGSTYIDDLVISKEKIGC